MQSDTTIHRSAGAASRRSQRTLLLPLYATTIFLSAFLLFAVQPFFARMVLPILGGSPAVWSVSMVFFQAALLAGYLYAHLLTRYFRVRLAVPLHAAVMAIALVVLPIAIPSGWTDPPDTGQAYWLLGLLSLAVGLPFFAVSANGPLLQAWFARSGHPHAHDPYFLYGASNIGSFASLLLFVALIEPALAVSTQSIAWSIGYAILLLAIIACGTIIAFRPRSPSRLPEIEDGAIANGQKPDFRLRAQWLAFAAIPSGLLVAVTAHISMDIAAAPFLWVVPLSLFLLTFVLAFARRPPIPGDMLSRILPFVAALIFLDMVMGSLLPPLLSLVLHLVFFFLAALTAHMALVSRRPSANHLTEFYFWMSLGGVTGGALTALASPALFDWIAEYPLLVAAALFCRPGMHAAWSPVLRIAGLAALLLALVGNNALLSPLLPDSPAPFAIAIAVLALLGAIAVLRSEAMHVASVIAICGLFFIMQGSGSILEAQRSFFGVVTATETADGTHHVMSHGTTRHGAMRIDPHQSPPEPIAYYHRSGGIAGSLFAAQRRWNGRNAEIGIVGLGVGSMLCHRRPGERWTSFEIDSAVIDIASDPSLFRYVSECGQSDPILIGDARRTLERQPDGKFDYLLIDAFSSDSIPLHLLTLEALDLYRQKLRPDGLLVFHISNRYVELRSVIAALARSAGMTGRAGKFERPSDLGPESLVSPSEVAVLAHDEAALGDLAQDTRWEDFDTLQVAPWTDDYANLLAAIFRRF